MAAECNILNNSLPPEIFLIMPRKYDITESEHLDKIRRAKQAANIKKKFVVSVEAEHIVCLESYSKLSLIKKKFVAERLTQYLKALNLKRNKLFKPEVLTSKNEKLKELKHFKTNYFSELVQYAVYASDEEIELAMKSEKPKLNQQVSYKYYYTER